LVGFLKVRTSRFINLVSDVFNDHGLLPLPFCVAAVRRYSVFTYAAWRVQ
jgi:hypothetical protein